MVLRTATGLASVLLALGQHNSSTRAGSEWTHGHFHTENQGNGVVEHLNRAGICQPPSSLISSPEAKE
jgi:hypothetical protein